jgi:hypothetical protein
MIKGKSQGGSLGFFATSSTTIALMVTFDEAGKPANFLAVRLLAPLSRLFPPFCLYPFFLPLFSFALLSSRTVTLTTHWIFLSF